MMQIAIGGRAAPILPQRASTSRSRRAPSTVCSGKYDYSCPKDYSSPKPYQIKPYSNPIYSMASSNDEAPLAPTAARGGSGGGGGSSGGGGGGGGGGGSGSDGEGGGSLAFLPWLYGAIVALGGVMGYIKKKSKQSLAAGVGCGGLIMASAASGNMALGLVVAAFLAYYMGSKFFATKKVMPAGVVGTFSAAMVLFYGSTFV